MKSLDNKRKIISQETNLSETYTNHGIRATSITIFDRKGYGAINIMSIGGYRADPSIRSYSRIGEEIKRK